MSQPHFETPQARCQFGIARGDITQPVGIYHRMWGAATHDRATGVHRPLTATAMILAPFSSGPLASARQRLAAKHDAQVVIALDLCLLWAKEMDDLLSAVAAGTGFVKQQIAVTFSHTHGAGLMGRERANLPGGEHIGPYLDSLAAEVTKLVNQAKATRPAMMVFGFGRCDLAAHRDFYDGETKQFVCGFNPAGPADDSVLVGKITSEDGKLLATLVNYACHPTTLAWQNTLISPDYVGAMREVVESATQAPCVFLQGASGDIGPREGFVGDTAIADRNGRQLGYAALSALEALPKGGTRFEYSGPVISGATLGTWKHEAMAPDVWDAKKRFDVKQWTVDLPYRTDMPNREQTQTDLKEWETKLAAAPNDQAVRDARAMIERLHRRLTRLANLPEGPTFPYPVTLMAIGDAIWVFAEGELYNRFQHSLRQWYRGLPIVIATLTNGSRPAYLPSIDAYGKSIYQETIAVLEKGSLEKLLDAVSDAIGRVANPSV